MQSAPTKTARATIRPSEIKTQSPSGSRGRVGVRISNLPPWLSLLCMVIYIGSVNSFSQKAPQELGTIWLPELVSLAPCRPPHVPSLEEADVEVPPGPQFPSAMYLHRAAASIVAARPSGKLATALVLRLTSLLRRPTPLSVRILPQRSGGKRA